MCNGNCTCNSDKNITSEYLATQQILDTMLTQLYLNVPDVPSGLLSLPLDKKLRLVFDCIWSSNETEAE